MECGLSYSEASGMQLAVRRWWMARRARQLQEQAEARAREQGRR